MAAAVEACAWDGGWYARAFDDEGRPVGVAAEERHRINMNPQTWCVIGEVASPERAARALDAMHEHLATEYGIALLAPPYEGSDPRVRGTSTYPPGAKENGGIFCHANAWAIVAAAMVGDGDRAYDYYRRILPLRRSDADRFLVEPYVYCQNICGPTHPQFGMGRNAWLTGTASWTFVAATQWILGIRPTYRGLRVAPALPSSGPASRPGASSAAPCTRSRSSVSAPERGSRSRSTPSRSMATSCRSHPPAPTSRSRSRLARDSRHPAGRPGRRAGRRTATVGASSYGRGGRH